MARSLKRKDAVQRDVEVEELTGSLDEVKQQINRYIKKYGEDAYIYLELYGYDCFGVVKISYKTPETDEEYKERCERRATELNVKKKQQQIDTEYQEYLRLKEKFEE